MADIRPFPRRAEQPGIETPETNQEAAASELLDAQQAEAEQRPTAGEPDLSRGRVLKFPTGEPIQDEPAEEISDSDRVVLRIEDVIRKNPEGWIKEVLAMGATPDQITKGLTKRMESDDDQDQEGQVDIRKLAG